jgi:hypothetical protein
MAAITSKKAKNVYDRAEDALDALDEGALDNTTARTKAVLLRNMLGHMKMELEHATKTGRLAPGSPELPGFVRTEPKVVPSGEAVKRLGRHGRVISVKVE